MAADPKVVERIRAMGPNEQEEIILQLTDYAAALIRWKTRWIPRGRLPAGEEAKDLAMEAIRRVLQGSRRWDPDAEPDLLPYLKSVVRSIMSDRLEKAEREALEPNSEEGDQVIDQIPAPGPDPEGDLIAAEEDEAANRMLEALDVDEDKLVLLCILDGTAKAADISAELGLPVKEVYRIKQKLKRRLLHLKEAN